MIILMLVPYVKGWYYIGNFVVIILIQVFIVLGFGISVILLICIRKVAKASLTKAVADNDEMEGIFSSSMDPLKEDHK
ncbi:hypothetical protein M0R45_010887 [Rubus argutus]|uniref:Uncharacterized protein n=1 Tax=Rubus argutus TaxID=59490 RepID=A0AAW1Y9H1_RUBAR